MLRDWSADISGAQGSVGAIPHVRRLCQDVERLTTTHQRYASREAAPLPLGLDKPGRTGYGGSTQDDIDEAVRGQERKETTSGADTRTHGDGRPRRPLR